jgi:hypothetical protein
VNPKSMREFLLVLQLGIVWWTSCWGSFKVAVKNFLGKHKPSSYRTHVGTMQETFTNMGYTCYSNHTFFTVIWIVFQANFKRSVLSMVRDFTKCLHHRKILPVEMEYYCWRLKR